MQEHQHICKFAHTSTQNQQQQELVNFAAKQQTRQPAPVETHLYQALDWQADSQSNPSKLHLLAETPPSLYTLIAPAPKCCCCCC